MPPRLRSRSQQLCLRKLLQQVQPHQQCRFASLAAATAPPPPIEQTLPTSNPTQMYPPTQPPSHKPPQFRKSQLHRQYASLLRSTPLILIFQHNNLKTSEWVAIRRELLLALRKVDEAESTSFASVIKMHIIQTGIFATALKVVEFFKADRQPRVSSHHTGDSPLNSSVVLPNVVHNELDSGYQHGLSKTAYEAVAANKKLRHGLEPLMSGPLMLLTLPMVSPAHLKVVLSILSSSKDFPAPKRRTNPSFHEPDVQNGLLKLLLLGARVEGKIFDLEGARWIGGIEGGLVGLQAQLVGLLQGFGANLTGTLEAASKSLYFTLEARRSSLEEEGNEDKKGDEVP